MSSFHCNIYIFFMWKFDSSFLYMKNELVAVSQVLKPTTRQKLRFEGEMYQKVLSEYLQTVPSYLGGKCACTKCSKLNSCNMQPPSRHEEICNVEQPATDFSDDEDPSYMTYEIDNQMNDTCDQVLRTAVMGVLMFWVLMALMAGLPDLVPMRR